MLRKAGEQCIIGLDHLLRDAIPSVRQGGLRFAQLGARLIDGVARKLAADFFRCFNERFTDPAQKT